MGRGPLCALVLLLSLGAARVKTQGEVCRAWIYGVKLSTRVFKCPQKMDQADALFCCGTCTSPYCCSSREGRLDQAGCSVRRYTVPPQDRSVSPQTVRDLLNVLWIGIGAVISLILCNWACACGANILRWLRLNQDWLRCGVCRDQLQQQMEQAARGPHPRTLVMGPSVPHGDYGAPDPPPYEDPIDSWVVQFQRANEENSEDEVVILPPPPLPPRTGPVHTAEPTLAKEEETTVEPPLEVETTV